MSSAVSENGAESDDALGKEFREAVDMSDFRAAERNLEEMGEAQ